MEPVPPLVNSLEFAVVDFSQTALISAEVVPPLSHSDRSHDNTFTPLQLRYILSRDDMASAGSKGLYTAIFECTAIPFLLPKGNAMLAGTSEEKSYSRSAIDAYVSTVQA